MTHTPPNSDAFDLNDLVNDLTPVSPLQSRGGMALAMAMTVLATLAVIMTINMRADLAAGSPDAMFFVRGLVLLSLGLAASYSVIALARPAVGNPKARNMWKYTLGLAILFPLGAIISLVVSPPPSPALAYAMFLPNVGLKCLTVSSLSAFVIGSAMTLWLQRGATVSPQHSGLLVGLASGAMGAAAYSFHCPINNIVYIGTWFTGAVAISTIAGWLIVPRLLRW